MKFSNSVYKAQAAIIAIFISFFISSTGWATTYYVDSRNGKDSNIGTLETSPWRTTAKVNTRLFQPGDAILFKRGEIWREELMVPSSGSASEPIMIGAYGSGNKPIITARDSIAGWPTAGKWINYSSNVWYIRCDVDPKRIWLSGMEYRKAQTLNRIDTNSRWYYDNGRKQLYVYAASNPALSYSNIEGATVRYTAVRVTGKDHIHMQNLDLRGGGTGSVVVSGSDYFIIEDSAIGRDSGAFGVFSMHNYPYSTRIASNYGVVRRSIIDSGHHLKYDYEYYPLWDGIKLQSGSSYWEVYSNIILDWSHSSVEIESQGSQYKSSYNEVYSNIMTCKNVSYCRGFAIGGPEGTAQHNKIYHNLVKDTTVRNQILGDHNLIAYNIIDTVTNVPYKTYGTGHALSLEGYAGYACHDNQILNNVMHNTDEPGIFVAAGGSNKENNSIKNNIFYNTGKNSKDGFTGYALLVSNDPTVKRNIYQNNDFYKSGVTNVISYRGTLKTVSGFNNENGKYDTIASNIQSNPLFVDPLKNNFRLQAQSLCIDAGSATGLPYDMDGHFVPQGGRTDIGAFEYPSPTNVTQNAQRK